MDLQKDLIIDASQLDVEWAKLPSLFHHYSEQVDITEDEIKKIKMKVELLECNLDTNIRKNPEKYTDSKKLTEGQIKSLIKIDVQISELHLSILNKENYKKHCMSICNSLSYKKDALKNLTTLYIGNLFTVPTNEKQSLEFIQKQQQNSKRNIRREIKKKIQTSKQTKGEGNE